MRALTLLFASAFAYGLLPYSSRLGTVLGAVVAVGFGVLLALAASFSSNAVAVASGAIGAFTSGVLASHAPALAGAALLGLAFAERTLRIRDRNSRIVHVVVALGAGGLAGYLAMQYSASEPLVRVVVIVIAAVLSAAPLMIPADDPVAHALDELGSVITGESGAKLGAAAELRRSVDEALLDSSGARDARRAWKNLLGLGQARARLSSAKAPSERAEAVIRRVDQRIAEHVDSLNRMYTAADAASAAGLSLDDAALRSVETTRETLDEVSKAIIEEAV
ncbi:MAG: hypothetical protein HYZ29_19740 [Myxococcales bacterium]|nr:hypothetical protein [Myxococcales bacterium]